MHRKQITEWEHNRSVTEDESMKKTQTYEEALPAWKRSWRSRAGRSAAGCFMKLFEEGIGLVDFCSRKLEKAEQKITELSEIPEKAEGKS